MKKVVTVWRESVYKNHFKCNICGRQIADENGNPIGRQRGNIFEGILQCPQCFNVVARYEEVDVPEGMTGLQGNCDDF